MNSINNNQFEIKPTSKSKRKITTPCPNAYLNPGLDILANEDPMCNTKMEIVPLKKRKRSKSCDIAIFENTGLDIGTNKPVVNQFLVKELENVKNSCRSCVSETNLPSIKDFEDSDCDKENIPPEEPLYANLTDLSVPQLINTEETIIAENPSQQMDLSGFQADMSAIEMDSGISVLDHRSTSIAMSNQCANNNSSTITTNIQTNVTNQVIVNNSSNINLSFIDRLALDSPNLSNQTLCLDDDLNESNIMEIKTITIITKKKRFVGNKKNTNPFLNPIVTESNTADVDFSQSVQNPFLEMTKSDIVYSDETGIQPLPTPQEGSLMPRRLFMTDTNSTVSTVNESLNTDQHEYENIDFYRSESPVYENINGETDECNLNNKQSKILGHDVSRFSAIDIMNLNKNTRSNDSHDSYESKRDLRHHIKKAGNKLSKRVLKTLKKTFKHDKIDQNNTLNPYEVPRKAPTKKIAPKESGIENPALNLDNSDEIEIEEIDDDEEHQYETVQTIRNTQFNMNLTPLRERVVDNDVSHNKTHTPGKKVRFDSTLNQEKLITGNSFDCGIQSPGFDAKIEKYHDELENCINERKYIQQNM